MLRRDELFEQRIIVAPHGRVHFFRVHMKQMAARRLISAWLRLQIKLQHRFRAQLPPTLCSLKFGYISISFLYETPRDNF